MQNPNRVIRHDRRTDDRGHLVTTPGAMVIAEADHKRGPKPIEHRPQRKPAHYRDRGVLKCECWCFAETKGVPTKDIQAGLTLPCDDPMCQHTDKVKRREHAARVEAWRRNTPDPEEA